MSERQNILSLLAASEPEAIREGAQLAGSARMQEAIPALAGHITSSNIGVQEAVDRALRKIGGPEVVHAVIPLLRSEDAAVRNLSMDLLRALGSTDLPALLDLLHDDDADIRIFASDILGSVGTALAVPALCHALLHDPEVNVRYQAAVSLGNLAFAESAPCLNKALQDEEWVQFATIEALTKVKDASSVQAMLKALDSSSDLVASIIVDALGQMGDLKAVPLLLRRLDSSPTPLGNKIVRAVVNIMGGRSLSLLGAKDCERLRGYLPMALEDEDKDVQEAALRGFSALGGQGGSECILRYAAKLDPERGVDRLAGAVEALVSLGETQVLEKALRTGDDMTVHIAMDVLLRVDEATAVELLMQTFWERSRDLQRVMILELAGRAGSERQDFFLDVLERHTDGNIIRGVLLFLGRKGDPAVVFEKITPFLDHPYNDVKESAIEACIALHTPEVEAFFKSLSRHADPVQRMIGVYVLGFFEIADSIEELTMALDDESPDVRRVTVEAFGRACPIREEYLELVEGKLGDENREVRMAVFDTLGRCSDERFIKCLLTGLEDADPWVRGRCAEGLGENRISEAVAPLVGMLEDENLLVVIKAMGALGKIGGEAAFRALLPMLDNPDRDLREAAEEAVGEIHRQAGER
ncbi:HEAT repeat domain-containing protein [Desulfovibrio sp. OttesenSCG-928-A18]|nr:HEAT repeat domain-containing protein [Desulfovibrio sp. OttesenSCG-928-A18]